jgi:hypothetical protein
MKQVLAASEDGATPAARFRDAMRRILTVSKKDVDARMASEKAKRARARKRKAG